GGGHRSLVLLVQGSGQHEMGVAGGLGEEEVDGDVDVQPVEHGPYEVAFGQRDDGVAADREQSADLATLDAATDIVGIHARLRQRVGRDPPDPGDMGAGRRIRQLAAAGELVALLAVFAPALTVALAGDRGVAAELAADASRGEHDVDRAEYVLDPMARMF